MNIITNFEYLTIVLSTINFLYIITFFAVLFIARFVFSRYYLVAEKYNLVKGFNNRAAHKGRVYTGAGLVLSFILLLVAVVLNNVEILFFERLASVISVSVLIAVVGFYDDFRELSAFQKYIVLSFFNINDYLCRTI